jgi:hypothetical protein
MGALEARNHMIFLAAKERDAIFATPDCRGDPRMHSRLQAVYTLVDEHPGVGAKARAASCELRGVAT